MISVVIPMYNSEKTIINVLEAVRKQTRIDLIDEVIIVNDGSKDNSLAMVYNYQNEHPEIKFNIIDIENGGVSRARNTGIQHAKSDWIALLDSDDEWYKTKIEKQVNVINQIDDVKFIGGGRNDEKVAFGTKVNDNLYYLNVKQVLFKTWPHTSTIMIYKDVFDCVGMFDESRKYAEDGQLWFKIAGKYKLYYIVESLELADGGKPAFGYSGLSSNMKKMHDGNMLNLKEALALEYINYVEYLMFSLYYVLKYYRRILLVKFSKKRYCL